MKILQYYVKLRYDLRSDKLWGGFYKRLYLGRFCI